VFTCVKDSSMQHCNDRDIISRILDGEPEAYSFLLRRYQRQVYSLIRQIVGSREDAEELTQDVFMKAFTRLGSFRGEAGISTWLYRIAYNTAISATRKKKLPLNDFDENLIGSIPDDEVDRMLEKENDEHLLSLIERALQKLLPEERALITLYYNGEKPVSEVASITGLSVDNVKVKLFRIRKKIVYLVNQPSI
jgi:RNA polymerase sigma-70 factor, ECF subfamily